MVVEMRLTGEAAMMISPHWPTQNEDALTKLSSTQLEKSQGHSGKSDGWQNLLPNLGEVFTGAAADKLGENMGKWRETMQGFASRAENHASALAMSAQNVFNTKNMLNAIGADYQAKLEAATAAQMGSAATGSVGAAASFEAVKTQLTSAANAAVQMIGGGFSAANAQLNQNIMAGDAVTTAPSMMPPTLSSAGSMEGWGAAPGMPNQYSDPGFYGNYGAGGSPMMYGMENQGGQMDYGAGAFGAQQPGGTYMGTGASYDGTPGSLINTLINNAPAVAQLAQTGMMVGDQAFNHLQQAAETVTAGVSGALGTYDGGDASGGQDASSGPAGAVSGGSEGGSGGPAAGGGGGAPAGGSGAGSGGSGSGGSSTPAPVQDSAGEDDSDDRGRGDSDADEDEPESSDSPDDGEDDEQDRSDADSADDEASEREAEVVEELSGDGDSSDDSSEGDTSPDPESEGDQEGASEPGSDPEGGNEPEPAPDQEPERESEPTPDQEPESDSEPAPAPQEDGDDGAQPNAGGAPPMREASADWDVTVGPDGVDGEVNTSLTSADPSQVSTQTSSAGSATAAPAAAPAGAAAPAAAGGPGGFVAGAPMAPAADRPAASDGWGRHHRADSAVAVKEREPIAPTARSNKELDGFGRTTRRAIRQLAALDDTLGTRESGEPLALALINPGMSVYCTADAFGFPEEQNASAHLPSGVVPLAAVVDEQKISDEFLAAWVGSTDPAGVLALAVRDGHLDPMGIFDVERSEDLPLPDGVEVITRTTLASATPAHSYDDTLLGTLPQVSVSDPAELVRTLANVWSLPLDSDPTVEEARLSVVSHRWDNGQDPAVLVATVWWLLIAAIDALVEGNQDYARAALHLVLSFPLPSS